MIGSTTEEHNTEELLTEVLTGVEAKKAFGHKAKYVLFYYAVYGVAVLLLCFMIFRICTYLFIIRPEYEQINLKTCGLLMEPCLLKQNSVYVTT